MIIGGILAVIMFSLSIYGGYKLIERDIQDHRPTMSEHQ